MDTVTNLKGQGGRGGAMEGPLVHALRSFPGGAVEAPIAFLDRDGVLNVSLDGYVNTPEELALIQGTAEAMRTLREAGFLLCVVTNQSAVDRGHWDEERLHQIHDRLDDVLKENNAQPDLILSCPHLPWARCGCRKPGIGMLELGAHLLRSADGFGPMRERWTQPYAGSAHAGDVMVGDRRSDVQAGLNFGARSFFSRRDLGLSHLVARLLDFDDQGDGVG